MVYLRLIFGNLYVTFVTAVSLGLDKTKIDEPGSFGTN